MPLPDPPVEIEFRDGVHAVPAWISANIDLAEIDPVRYTYEEAVRLADKAVERRFINDFAQRTIDRHFTVNR